MSEERKGGSDGSSEAEEKIGAMATHFGIPALGGGILSAFMWGLGAFIPGALLTFFAHGLFTIATAGEPEE